MFGIDIPKTNVKELLIIGGSIILGYTIYSWLYNKPSVADLLDKEVPTPLIINDVRPVFKDKVKEYIAVPPDVGIGKTNYGDTIFKKTYPTRDPDSNTVHNPYYMDLGRYATLIDTTL